MTKTAVADAIYFEWVGNHTNVTADAARFVQNDAQEISYILWDNLFTPKKLVDSSGTVVWDAALKPYGAEESILGSAVMNLRMPGQYVDEETGRGSGSSLTHPLYYNYNRDYDPATGRYTQVDPIGLAGGNNPYRYANGSPRVYIDPDGLFEFRIRPLGDIGVTFGDGDTNDNNLGAYHEHGFYDDGTDVGYGPDGIGSDDPDLRDNYGDPLTDENGQSVYDDDIMRQAEKNLRNSGLWEPEDPEDGFWNNTNPNDYQVILHNCQDFSDALREEYRRLEEQQNLN